MANIVLPHTWVPLEVPSAANWNANEQEIRDKFNTYAVQTDVAKTISVAHTFAADILFSDALYDIGKSGATRPRDGFFSRNLTVGGTLRTATSIALVNDTGGTGSVLIALGNNGNTGVYFGVENSVGGTIVGGTSAYSTVLGSSQARSLHLATSNTVRLTVDSNGTVTVGASAGQSLVVNGVNGNYTQKVQSGVGSGNAFGLLVNAGSTSGDSSVVVQNAAQTLTLFHIRGDGVVMVGSPSTAVSAAVGELVLGNNKALRGANAGGTGTKGLIYLDTSDRVQLAGDGLDTQIGGNSAATSGALYSGKQSSGNIANGATFDFTLPVIAAAQWLLTIKTDANESLTSLYLYATDAAAARQLTAVSAGAGMALTAPANGTIRVTNGTGVTAGFRLSWLRLT